VLNIGNGVFYQLNATAARIWIHLESPSRLDAICAQLVERYEVSLKACRSDVAEAIEQMRSAGIVEEVSAAG
jgi:hypothetical protein